MVVSYLGHHANTSDLQVWGTLLWLWSPVCSLGRSTRHDLHTDPPQTWPDLSESPEAKWQGIINWRQTNKVKGMQERIKNMYLCPAGALQYMHKCTGHLLLIPHTDNRLEHWTQHSVVVGNKFCKFLIEFHGQDCNALKAALDTDGGAAAFHLAAGGCAHWVPFLHKLASTHSLYWDVHQSNIVTLVFFLFLVSITIYMHNNAVDSRQTTKLKVLTPE